MIIKLIFFLIYCMQGVFISAVEVDPYEALCINRGASNFEILGLQDEASSVEIRKAYRRLVLQWHPDKNKDTEVEEVFKLISKAYEELTSDKSEDCLLEILYAPFRLFNKIFTCN